MRKCVDDININALNQSGNEVIINSAALVHTTTEAELVDWDYHVDNILPARWVRWSGNLGAQAAFGIEHKCSWYIIMEGNEEGVHILGGQTQ
jgi:hypothetical protein